METTPPQAPADELRLGLNGFTYSDLYKPERLKDLQQVFESSVSATNPELFAAWNGYRSDPGSPRTPVEISALLAAMAEHVSRFVIRLFAIQAEADALAAATAEQNPVFRFKVDFVRRRVLPALGKIVTPADPEHLDERIVRLRMAVLGAEGSPIDPELATALAAVQLMEAERGHGSSEFISSLGAENPATVKDWLEHLKQWCALHLHDREYSHWVSFRFPESIDHFNLLEHGHRCGYRTKSSSGPALQGISSSRSLLTVVANWESHSYPYRRLIGLSLLDRIG
jgi:hypothetical protein